LDINKVVNYIVGSSCKILDAGRCSIMLYDQRREALSLRGYYGFKKENITKKRVKLGEPVAGQVAQEGRPVLCRNIESDLRFKRKNQGSYSNTSFMSVPIFSNGVLLGLINISDKKSETTNEFSEFDLRILCMIARQTAVALETASRYKKARDLAVRDPLTNLYNFRYFNQRLESEITRAQRYKLNLSLMIIDVDNFKFYNDTFGHTEGDQLLKEISGIFKASLRKSDIVCRYAGDEFAVILPETNRSQAQIAGTQIINRLKNISLKANITVSIGVTQYYPHMDRNDLVAKADVCLYEVKKQGKNTVCCG